MKIAEGLSGLEYRVLKGSADAEVSEVIYDSRKASPGAVFVCMVGTRSDSHAYIPQVLEKGVRVLVVERAPEEQALKEMPEDTTVILVDESRAALARLSAARFGYPARKLVCIGVTGTKGKTTITYMIKAILEASGKKAGLIGTAGAVIGEHTYPTVNTTPESYELHRYFAQMAEEGCEYMIMEVSSQGVKMHRTDGIEFDYGVFSNISNDHIGPGEHADFAEYLWCKSQLLKHCRVCLVNRDDEHFEEILEAAYGGTEHGGDEAAGVCGSENKLESAPGSGVAHDFYEQTVQSENKLESVPKRRFYTFALDHPADFMANEIRYIFTPEFVGLDFQIRGRYELGLRVNIPGRFNVYNALAAAAVCSFLDLPEERVCHALEHLYVSGRMEIVHTSARCTVLVDYAHNAVSMESLLRTLRDYHPKRLVCVFGCGGNRSKDRRYAMGEIGGRLADLCILTADNSRYERVEDILADIRGSMEKTGGAFVEIPDRREAIRYSIRHAQPGDLIAVIGKGHEDYQEIAGVRYPFLDRKVIEEVIEELESEEPTCRI